MFKGLGITIATVAAFLLLVPAVMLWASGGSDWLNMLRMMTPSL